MDSSPGAIPLQLFAVVNDKPMCATPQPQPWTPPRPWWGWSGNWVPKTRYPPNLRAAQEGAEGSTLPPPPPQDPKGDRRWHMAGGQTKS